MRFAKTSAVLVLTLFWVFATNHCALESIPGLRFLTCATHDEAPQQDEKGCESDGCAKVENQLYRAEDGPVSAPVPLLQLACVLVPLWTEFAATREVIEQVQPDATPPELCRRWRFTQRTALPPRAPSLSA